MASKKLVQLAKRAAAHNAKAAEATRAWVNRFRIEYGHDEISDVLVEAIDYSAGDTSCLTAQFIDDNSEPGLQ